jgi:hypothetical protein
MVVAGTAPMQGGEDVMRQKTLAEISRDLEFLSLAALALFCLFACYRKHTTIRFRDISVIR